MLQFFRDLLGAEADQSALAQTAPTELATVMIELLVEAAKADGGLAAEEQQLISQIMAHHFELSADELALTESSKLGIGQKSRIFEQIEASGRVNNLRGYLLKNNTVKVILKI